VDESTTPDLHEVAPSTVLVTKALLGQDIYSTLSDDGRVRVLPVYVPIG
jgi:hypothetical protein